MIRPARFIRACYGTNAPIGSLGQVALFTATFLLIGCIFAPPLAWFCAKLFGWWFRWWMI